MEKGATLIELHDANVSRTEASHPEVVVKHVNWTIQPGDFWVVGGLPGSGKSDLLATAAALQKPMSGTHLLFGRDVQHMNEEELLDEKRRIGFVFGNGRLFMHSTVAENVALPICYHKNCTYEQAEPQAMEVLKATGLEAMANRRPREVTRNLHQRIGLARALALEPEVLLLDNPLAGVDPRLGRWWIDFLCKASNEGIFGRKITMSIATDDFRPWQDVGREFAIIHDKVWKPIGGRENLRSFEDPILAELMS